MSSSRDRGPPDQPLQPPEAHLGTESELPVEDDVLSRRLAQFDGEPEAKRVQRFADERILRKLEEAEFDPDGADWRLFSAALIEYSAAVLTAWASEGVLQRRAIERGVRGAARAPCRRFRGEMAEALVLDVVIAAVRAFRDTRLSGWDPTGGASLKTYFIGRCLMELPDVYQAWRKREDDDRICDPYPVVDSGRCDSPVSAVEARVLLDEIFEYDPAIRRAFVLQQAGYSLEEIARLLAKPGTRTSVAALRSRMYRLRMHAAGWEAQGA